MFTKLKLLISQWLVNLTKKLRNNFYLYLAALLSLFVLFDAGVLHLGENMRDKAFDLMVKNRLFKPKADQAIVIVDINEASLAALSKEFGRWPWPRQVLGEFVENIEAQNPKAIVFDIVFSDADIYNEDSDAYFNEVIAGTKNTLFPILRLDPSQDKLSALKYKQIPGIIGGSISEDGDTVAAIMPYFKAAWQPNRLGTHNVYADSDGIVRQYRMVHDDAGWLLPSLPAAVAKFVGAKNTENLPKDMLINWRGKPFTYTYATFSDVYADLGSKTKKRPQNEFTDKIVIIGSTAPGLLDIKATAIAKDFPGVEILATAIDNAKHGDYLKVWRGKLPYILLSFLLIWATAFAFYRQVDRDRLTPIFSFSQIGLLLISFAVINFSNSYLDLTAPILWAIAYFSIAKIYALATDRALQRWLAFGVKTGDVQSHALLMPILIDTEIALDDGTLKKIARQVELSSQTPSNVDVIKGTQGGIWGLFGDMLIVSWTFAQNNTQYADNAKTDAAKIAADLSGILSQVGLPSNTPVRYTTHDGALNAEQPLDNQWRSLFAQAIIKLENS